MSRSRVQARGLDGRQPPRERASGRAFTLIETLAVVGLLAVAMAVGAVHLSGATRRARINASLHTLTLADGTARSMAMSGNSTCLAMAASRAEVIVRDRRTTEPVWRQPLAPSIRGCFESSRGEPIAELAFDPIGRCSDYIRVALEKEKAVERVLVSGITGWSTRDVEAPR